MSAVTVVNGSIGEMYRESFGAQCRVVRNAGPIYNLEPRPLKEGHIRLVHSGGAIPGRNLESLIEAVRSLGPEYTLDLYLVPSRDGGRYLRQLRQLIGDETRITLHDPVRPVELAPTLNAYDVGVFSLPPLTPNHRLMLPNKIFDFVQARLAVVFNSAPETDRLIDGYGFGTIAPDHTASSMRETLAALTSARIWEFKQNAHRAAAVLNSAEDSAETRAAVTKLLAAGSHTSRSVPPSST